MELETFCDFDMHLPVLANAYREVLDTVQKDAALTRTDKLNVINNRFFDKKFKINFVVQI